MPDNGNEPLSQEELDALMNSISVDEGNSAEMYSTDADEPSAVSDSGDVDELLGDDQAVVDMPFAGMAPTPAPIPSAARAPLHMASFEDSIPVAGGPSHGLQGFDRVQDIPLEITVELGRTRLLIKDILELGSGSIIELEKMAGEPVDLLANGLLIARGEVVVIEDAFGVRITEIITSAERKILTENDGDRNVA